MNTTDKDTQLTHEQIATCAYLLWESDGRKEGCDAEYWYRAQTTLKAGPFKTGTASSAQRALTTPTREASAPNTPPKTEEATRKRKQNPGAARRQPAFV